MRKERKEAAKRLYEMAEGQQGFFTTKQAKAAGFAENTHPYHVQAGNWIREHRGIYRLATIRLQQSADQVSARLNKYGRPYDPQVFSSPIYLKP